MSDKTLQRRSFNNLKNRSKRCIFYLLAVCLCYFLTINVNGQNSTKKTALKVVVKKTDPSCHNLPNGGIHLQVSRGLPPYTYAWSTGGTQSYERGLKAGSYTVVVTDSNKEQIVKTIELASPGALSIPKITHLDTDESGVNSTFPWQGTAVGGTPPYKYVNGIEFVIGEAEIDILDNELAIKGNTGLEIIRADIPFNTKEKVLKKYEGRKITEIGFVIVVDDNKCTEKRYLPQKTSEKFLLWDDKASNETEASIHRFVAPPSIMLAPASMIVANNDNTLEDLELSYYTKRAIPKKLGNRSVMSNKQITISGDEVEITVWDDQTEDGDTISIFYNGEWVLKEFPLRNKKKKLILKVEDNADNYLILYANNLGSRPPNTAAVRINDGYLKRKIGLSSDLRNCDAIKFRKKE